MAHWRNADGSIQWHIAQIEYRDGYCDGYGTTTKTLADTDWARLCDRIRAEKEAWEGIDPTNWAPVTLNDSCDILPGEIPDDAEDPEAVAIEIWQSRS